MNSFEVDLLGYRHTIHVFEAPDERASVVAIHGFGTSGQSFRHAAPMLNAAGITVIAPDQLGFGDSEKPEAGYSLHLYAQLVIETVESTGIRNPVLLGHSAGGKVAAAAAALFRDSFSGLVLVNTGGFSVLAPILVLADSFLFRIVDTPFFRKRILKRFQIAETVETPEQWEAFRRFHGENAALDIDRSGLRPAVRGIDIPTLVVWGVEDRMIPNGTIARIRRDIPHTSVVTMPDSGHAPMRDEPEKFAAHVADFVLNIAAGSTGPDLHTIGQSGSDD